MDSDLSILEPEDCQTVGSEFTDSCIRRICMPPRYSCKWRRVCFDICLGLMDGFSLTPKKQPSVHKRTVDCLVRSLYVCLQQLHRSVSARGPVNSRFLPSTVLTGETEKSAVSYLPRVWGALVT